MKITPNHMISPHLEAKRRGYNCCTVGNLPKKEVVYPKREIGIDRPQKSYMNYKILQKSDIDYKLY